MPLDERRGGAIVNSDGPAPKGDVFRIVLLGHTAEGLQADSEIMPRNLRACEAEAVALICWA
jgi:hypothetical protein